MDLLSYRWDQRIEFCKYHQKEKTTENHAKRLTYITIKSGISPPDSGMHAIDKLIVSGGRMSYNQG